VGILFLEAASGNIFTDNRTGITHITLNSLHANCKRHSDEEGSGKTSDPMCSSLSVSKLPPYFLLAMLCSVDARTLVLNNLT